MAINDPRQLKALQAYIDALNGQDNATGVTTLVDTLTTEELTAKLAISVTATINHNGKVMSSTFNSFAGKYIKDNIKTIAPSITALIANDVDDKLAAAEAEAGALGLTPVQPEEPGNGDGETEQTEQTP